MHLKKKCSISCIFLIDCNTNDGRKWVPSLAYHDFYIKKRKRATPTHKKCFESFSEEGIVKDRRCQKCFAKFSSGDFLLKCPPRYNVYPSVKARIPSITVSFLILSYLEYGFHKCNATIYNLSLLIWLWMFDNLNIG